ncbi:MAG: hypothetical protein K0S86_348 [Geminicoccaceae bacterium]|nr:hypothetical protein [Geminicoccaceae bacterium]
MTVNTAVAPPMPRANVAMAMTRNVGDRRSDRSAYRSSRSVVASAWPTRASRAASLTCSIPPASTSA